jgi:hypothetical protein
MTFARLESLNPKKWYVKYFFWSVGIWEEFTDRDRARGIRENGTNFCFFLRVMLVWAPAVIILHIIAYGGAIFALTVVPVALFGAVEYVAVIGATSLTAVIIFAIKKSQQSRSAVIRRPHRGDFEEELEFGSITTTRREDLSLGGLILMWLLAQKMKICPTVTFANESRRNYENA